jgi:hypothetical protein
LPADSKKELIFRYAGELRIQGTYNGLTPIDEQTFRLMTLLSDHAEKNTKSVL